MDVIPDLHVALLFIVHKADVPVKYKLVQMTDKQLIITQHITH